MERVADHVVEPSRAELVRRRRKEYSRRRRRAAVRRLEAVDVLCSGQVGTRPQGEETQRRRGRTVMRICLRLCLSTRSIVKTQNRSLFSFGRVRDCHDPALRINRAKRGSGTAGISIIPFVIPPAAATGRVERAFRVLGRISEYALVVEARLCQLKIDEVARKRLCAIPRINPVHAMRLHVCVRLERVCFRQRRRGHHRCADCRKCDADCLCLHT